MSEIERLKANLVKLEELTSKLSFLLKEIDYIVGGKNGHTNTNSTDVHASTTN